MKSTKKVARPKRNSNDVLGPQTLPRRSHTPAISQENQEHKTITHNNEKVALILFLTGGFAI